MTVRSEVEKIVITWANSQTPKILVCVENVPFIKPPNTTGKYVEVIILGSTTTVVTVDGKREREVGIIQINCCVPQGTGAKAGEDLAEYIKNLFPVVPKVGTVSIERPANISRALDRDDGFRIVPVRINYRQERFS